MTKIQRRLLRVIKKMEDGPDGYGHDAEGDLSMCSGNLPFTMRVLRRNGYIASYTVREPDYYYTEVVLTDAGRKAAS